MTRQLYDYSGGKLWLDPDRSGMERLMSEDTYEARKVALMRRFLQPGMSFADVGAHCGYFTFIAAKLVGETGKVYSFEPDDECMDWLEENVSANEWAWERVIMHRMAVGSCEARIQMYKGTQPGFTSTVRSSAVTFDRHQVRLDAVLPNVDMLKIDVEGMELDVLEGMKGLFEQKRPMTVLLDLHPELGLIPDGVEVTLKRQGFELFDIRADNAPIERVYDSLVELLAVRT